MPAIDDTWPNSAGGQVVVEVELRAGRDGQVPGVKLGYADQGNFTRDSTRSIGASPAQYARES